MGSYADCYLGPFHIGSSKRNVDPFLMEHFCAIDKVITTDFDALPAVLKERYERADPPDEEGPPNETFPFVFYRASLSVVRDRLAVRGYTYAAACDAFAQCIQLELAQERRSAEEHADLFETSIQVLEAQSVERWQEALRKIARDELTWRDQQQYAGTLIGEMLKSLGQTEDWYGYPGVDTNVPLRIAVEACSEGDELVYDLTDLIWTEDAKPDEDFVQRALDVSDKEHAGSTRTVVLTEGRFDAFVLSESLRLLFPHLLDYYSFMDFDTYDPEGGAAALVKQVKAFAAAGIVNRIVAIFDNDAAAHDAMRSLKSLKLPSSIQIMHLPDFEFLRNYPTLGPAGESKMDVNGVAASIEVYLGREVLTSPSSGDLVCVQWKGFVAGVGKYQGEILDKRAVQDRFRAKLRASVAEGSELRSADWAGIHLILKRLFEIFHQEDAKAMAEMARWQYENGYSRA